MTKQLLSLVGNADGFALFAHGHTRSSLLCANSSCLGLVLDECNTFAARNQSDFLESFEATKDR